MTTLRRTARVWSRLSEMGAAHTGSSAANPVPVPEGDISRDISDLRQELVSLLLNSSSHQAATWKLLGVLLDRIDSTASKMETLLKEVHALKITVAAAEVARPKFPPEIWSARDLETPLMTAEEMAYFDSLLNIPDTISSPDLTCYETIAPSAQQSTDQASTSGGSMVPPEWAKVAPRTTFSRRPM